MSALPAFLPAPVDDDFECDCTLIEEHLERCAGRPVLPLPNVAPIVTYSYGEASMLDVELADPVIVRPAPKLRLVPPPIVGAVERPPAPERGAVILQSFGRAERGIRISDTPATRAQAEPEEAWPEDEKGDDVLDTPVHTADTKGVTIAHTPEQEEPAAPVPLRAHNHRRGVAAALDRYAERMARKGGTR